MLAGRRRRRYSQNHRPLRKPVPAAVQVSPAGHSLGTLEGLQALSPVQFAAVSHRSQLVEKPGPPAPLPQQYWDSGQSLWSMQRRVWFTVCVPDVYPQVLEARQLSVVDVIAQHVSVLLNEHDAVLPHGTVGALQLPAPSQRVAASLAPHLVRAATFSNVHALSVLHFPSSAQRLLVISGL